MTEKHRSISFLPETHVDADCLPLCGAHAQLMRRPPHPELKAEIRTFECMDCKKQTAMTV